MVALETTFSSTPRCTMVWAICGRMPLMMQSAPISRAAEIVLIRCCATSVSTVGTPVMSMMAISAPEVTMRCSRLSMTICVRALSSVPISGRARMPSHSLHHRRRELEQLLLLAGDHLLAGPRVALDGVEAEPVDQPVGDPGLPASRSASSPSSSAQQREQRLLQREDEDGRLARAEALHRAVAREVLQQLAHRPPFRRSGYHRIARSAAPRPNLAQKPPRQLGGFGRPRGPPIRASRLWWQATRSETVGGAGRSATG